LHSSFTYKLIPGKSIRKEITFALDEREDVIPVWPECTSVTRQMITSFVDPVKPESKWAIFDKQTYCEAKDTTQGIHYRIRRESTLMLITLAHGCSVFVPHESLEEQLKNHFHLNHKNWFLRGPKDIILPNGPKGSGPKGSGTGSGVSDRDGQAELFSLGGGEIHVVLGRTHNGPTGHAIGDKDISSRNMGVQISRGRPCHI
jgi:hypothetical protein